MTGKEEGRKPIYTNVRVKSSSIVQIKLERWLYRKNYQTELQKVSVCLLDVRESYDF